MALLLQKLHMHWQHQHSAVKPPSTIAPNFINKKLMLSILSTDLNAWIISLRVVVFSHDKFHCRVYRTQKSTVTNYLASLAYGINFL